MSTTNKDESKCLGNGSASSCHRKPIVGRKMCRPCANEVAEANRRAKASITGGNESTCLGNGSSSACPRKGHVKNGNRCGPCASEVAAANRRAKASITGGDEPKCLGNGSTSSCHRKPRQGRKRCRICTADVVAANQAAKASITGGDKPKCLGYPSNLTCSRRPLSLRSLRCILCTIAFATIERDTKDPGKGEEFCYTPGCTNLRSTYKRTTTKGEAKMAIYLFCHPCLRIRGSTSETKERSNIRAKGYYKIKTLSQQREWKAIYQDMPSLKHVPSSTSKFGLQVYAQVFNALASYNIRFKAEFNYLQHHLYQKAPASRELGLRADLLVEIDLKGREWPLTIVIEAQGTQHRPLLGQHLGNVKKQINQHYTDLVDVNRSLLLDVVQAKNTTQLQHDLAKLFMSIKQGFVHIIVYDTRSVQKAIGDALEGKENMRVYYPNGDGVDKNVVIDQFINQLLFREGFWRPCSSPSLRFELSSAFSTMCNDETLAIHDDDTNDAEDESMGDDEITSETLTISDTDPDSEEAESTADELSNAFSTMYNDETLTTPDDDTDGEEDETITLETLAIPDDDTGSEEDESVGDEATTDEQEDRVNIRMRLEEIDSKFLDFTPVKNLTIDFTQGHASSINAQQQNTTSSFTSSKKELLPEQKFAKKRAYTEELSSNNPSPITKKKKTN